MDTALTTTRSVKGERSIMLKTTWIVAFTLLASACAAPLPTSDPESAVTRPTESIVGKSDHAGTCAITLCLTGAMNHETPSNRHFRDLCSNAQIPGLVPDCFNGECNDTFDSFLQFPLLTVYPALIEALDRTGDGRIDDDDPVCEVNLIGFSWGGVNAVSIAGHLAHDNRVPDSHRRISNLVLLDAFQPFSAGRMRIPETVERVLSVRHSQAPHHDCSESAPLGPYLGLSPVCTTASTCYDYDYSRSPDELFYGRGGYPVYGGNVGHCDIPYMAERAVVSFLNAEPFEDTLPARR